MKIKESLLKQLSIDFLHLKKSKKKSSKQNDIQESSEKSKIRDRENFHRPITKCF